MGTHPPCLGSSRGPCVSLKFARHSANPVVGRQRRWRRNATGGRARIVPSMNNTQSYPDRPVAGACVHVCAASCTAGDRVSTLRGLRHSRGYLGQRCEGVRLSWFAKLKTRSFGSRTTKQDEHQLQPLGIHTETRRLRGRPWLLESKTVIGRR